MKLEDYIEQVIGEYKDSVRTKKATAVSLGFLPTRDIVPLLGLSTLAGARLPLERMIKAGFVERKHINPVRFAFRLSPRFKSWAKAAEEARRLQIPSVPAGWVSLTNYARKNKRTVRGIQYRIDDAKLPFKVIRNPRPVKHYRAADLDRILRKRT